MVKCTMQLMKKHNWTNEYALKRMLGQDFEDLETLYATYDDYEMEDGFKNNCCCDTYGFCSGSSCKFYDKCQIR